MSSANNRLVTLKGQNLILEGSGIHIRHNDDLGFYYLDFEGKRWAKATLTELCRVFVKHLIASRSQPAEPAPAEAEANG